MKTLIAAIVSLGALSAAQAIPLAPLTADGLTVPVAQGCGPGMARNARGSCRPKFMTRSCRPGQRRNALGICRPIR
jgi:hypothetical protein